MAKKVKKKTAKEKEIAEHKKMIRSIFRQSGFERFPKFADKEFNFKGQISDIDDFWVFENVLVCCEYTTHNTSKRIGTHLKNKKIIFDKIQDLSLIHI